MGYVSYTATAGTRDGGQDGAHARSHPFAQAGNLLLCRVAAPQVEMLMPSCKHGFTACLTAGLAAGSRLLDAGSTRPRLLDGLGQVT